MDLGLPLRFIIAFIVVMALIMLTAWLIKRFSGGRMLSHGWARGKDHRIEVIDATPVDAKRRLVLVRRDTVEHLVLIGGTNDIVVETGIAPPPAIAQAKASAKAPENTDTGPKTKATAPEPPKALSQSETSEPPKPEPAKPMPAFKARLDPAPVPAPAVMPPEPKSEPAAATPRPALDRDQVGLTDMSKRLEKALRPLDLTRKTAAAPPIDRVPPPTDRIPPKT